MGETGREESQYRYVSQANHHCEHLELRPLGPSKKPCGTPLQMTTCNGRSFFLLNIVLDHACMCEYDVRSFSSSMR